MARALDLAIIAGSGSGAEPYGVTTTSGIPTDAIGTNGGPLTWESVVGLETTLMGSNGVVDESAVAYVTSSKGLAQAKTIVKVSGYPMFIYDDVARRMNGISVVSTNAVSSTLTKGTTSGTCTGLILGDWSQCLVGSYGPGFEMIVDPFSAADSGSVRLVAFHTLDIAFRHDESFVKCLDVTTV